LVPYHPPTEAELIQLPPLPLVERDVRYPLAIRLGRGSSPRVEDFETAPNLHGFNETVCRQWKFIDGLFINNEKFVWPGNPNLGYFDLLVYDPNWPWNRLLLTERSYGSAYQLLMEKGVSAAAPAIAQPRRYQEIIASRLRMMIHQSWRTGELVWQPGDFVIPLMALERDIVDIRSQTRKYYEERFEGMRLAQQERVARAEQERIFPSWLAGLLE
jgi:hypothetical protein